MNRTTYKSDYGHFDWLQNNLVSNVAEFCSSENIDECLKYISQEFCALGYPSIYSDSSNCLSAAANCDIVQFLNVVFDLLKSNNEHAQTKEDLESRNQRLSSDLNVCNKKNSQLKNALEQNERKLAGSLEKERRLKEKNDQLSQLLKSEKEETKKLAAQLRQQKTIYQHEYRKYENNMNQIKAKLNQILSDKNPNKKIATISTSFNLPRNDGQRGKWKTSTSTTTAIEDMYKSVIASYETRCKDMAKEINAFRQCLESVLLQMMGIISLPQDENDGNFCSVTSTELILKDDIKRVSRNVQTFEETFKHLLCTFKENTLKMENYKNLEDEIVVLKSRIFELERRSSQVDKSQINEEKLLINREDITKSLYEEFIKKEKMKLDEQKIALSKSLENIKKEKACLAAEKLSVLRLAMQQKIAPSPWHHTLNTVPSISVVTYRNGETKILTSDQALSSASSLGQLEQSNKALLPELKSNKQVPNRICGSLSDTALISGNRSATELVESSLTPDIKLSDSDLPSWAIKNPEEQNLIIDDNTHNATLEVSHNVSTDEIDLTNESSSEELSLLRLKAAILDIEKRKINIS